MAAVHQAPTGEIADLTGIRSADLEALLEEETRVWRQQLDWDFQPSAGLVRRYVDMRALSGYALRVDEKLVGYSYSVTDEHKGLICDLYVMEQFRSAENENRLLAAVLEALFETPYLRRVESQLMLLSPMDQRLLPSARYLRTFERQFMTFDLSRLPSLKPKAPRSSVVFDQWTERRQDDTAQAIAAAYRGHIDSQINDQYRSPGGARRFLHNIIHYPGCGSFFAPASWVAIQRSTGCPCGLCLASLVAGDVGHITQICVTPPAQGAGLGYELLRRSLASLAGAGCRQVSLTVTSSNTGAIRLYERMGFASVRRFRAMVWER